MSKKFPSVALLSFFLLVSGCGEPEQAPSLPGPVQVSSEDFVSAGEYRFTPGSVLETTNLQLDYINPRFDQGLPVRNTTSQGSGDARIDGVEARLLPVNEIPTLNNVVIDSETRNSALAIQIASTTPLVDLRAFGPNDNRLSSQFPIAGLTAISTNPNDPRIRPNTSFRALTLDDEDRILADLTLTVRRILVSRDGRQVILDGDTSLTVRTLGVLFEDGGPGPEGEELTAGSFVNPDDEGITAILRTGRFSMSLNVRQQGVAGDGTGEDPLSLLARLNFVPNQAELVYRPSQVGSTSVLFAPDPQRSRILPNQLVQIRRLLNGRIQAEFDPANVSTVLNFVQVTPPPGPFSTPIPQLPIGEGDNAIPQPGPPTAFDYFFSLRTERPDGGNDPVELTGFIPTTGDFIFRNLAGAQLGGPFNRADIGGSLQRGNLNLVFSQSTTSDNISGEWFIEQEFPTDDSDVTPNDAGNILIIRGTFNGSSAVL
jgi:hypothetical protein